MTLLVILAIILLTLRHSNGDRAHRFLFVPLFIFLASMAYLSEMSYETAMLVILVPATALAAWLITELARWIGHVREGNSGALQIGASFLILSTVLANPLQDWLALFHMANRDGTRSSARQWIHQNVPEGSSFYIAPYTYTVPLIESLDQLRRSAPDSELARWREENKVGRNLSPTYHLFTDWRAALEQGAGPEYYVSTSFAHVPENCLWQGVWAALLCPYDPLRGSLPHFSQVNQIPDEPPDPEMVLLREFNPICPQSRNQTVYINYRTNVLRNNVRHLCRFGPIIHVYRLSGSFTEGLAG
jgi:hypothetical protein